MLYLQKALQKVVSFSKNSLCVPAVSNTEEKVICFPNPESPHWQVSTIWGMNNKNEKKNWEMASILMHVISFRKTTVELLEQNVKYNKIEPAGYELEGHLIWGKPRSVFYMGKPAWPHCATHTQKPVFYTEVEKNVNFLGILRYWYKHKLKIKK